MPTSSISASPFRRCPQTNCPSSPYRAFQTSSYLAASSFLDLGNLSISRESRYLAKAQGRPRTEFSPYLDLIRSSEVEPFSKEKGDSNMTKDTRDAKLVGSTNLCQTDLTTAELRKDLAIIRNAYKKAEKSLKEAHRQLMRRENEAALLLVFVVILITTLALHSDLHGISSDKMLKWLRTVVATQVTHGKETSSSVPDRQMSNHVRPQSSDLDHSAAVLTDRSNQGTFLSRLMWAS